MKTKRTKSRILLRQTRRALARQFAEWQSERARSLWLRQRCQLLERKLRGLYDDQTIELEALTERLRQGYIAVGTNKPHDTLPRLFYGYRLPDGRECYVVRVDRRDYSVGVRFSPCTGDSYGPEATFGRRDWEAWDHIIDGLVMPWDDE